MHGPPPTHADASTGSCPILRDGVLISRPARGERPSSCGGQACTPVVQQKHSYQFHNRRRRRRRGPPPAPDAPTPRRATPSTRPSRIRKRSRSGRRVRRIIVASEVRAAYESEEDYVVFDGFPLVRPSRERVKLETISCLWWPGTRRGREAPSTSLSRPD